MGSLRDEIQREVAAAFNSDLSDAVATFTLVSHKAETYDPVTGAFTASVRSYSGRGVLKNQKYLDRYVTGGAMDEYVNTLTVLQNELPVAPKTDDEIRVRGLTFRIVFVREDAAQASWVLGLI